MRALLLRRRGSLSEILAVIAFAASSAILATVLGGVLAFADRAGVLGPGGSSGSGGSGGSSGGSGGGTEDLAGLLAICAVIAAALLVPTAMSLGASAARLSLVRRERDLAAIRLIGGTTGQVAGIAVLDVVVQALLGAVVGIGLHLAVTPLLTGLDFGMAPFSFGELVLPVWGYPVLVVGFVLLAALSAAVALVGVAVSPLGVARDSRRVRVSMLRAVVWVLILGLFLAATKMAYPDEGVAVAVLVIFMIIVVGGVNVIGPLLVWLCARVVAAVAPWPSWLVAARRLAADPRSGWRTVSGITFGLVVAGMLTFVSLMATTDGDPEAAAISHALVTGGYLTLAIAAVLAAVSTGVTQAARVIDHARTYRSQHIGGADLAQLHRARIAEVVIPVALSSVVATISSLVLLSPVLGGMASSPLPFVLYVLAAIGAYLLVAAAVAASAPLVRRVALARG